MPPCIPSVLPLFLCTTLCPCVYPLFWLRYPCFWTGVQYSGRGKIGVRTGENRGKEIGVITLFTHFLNLPSRSPDNRIDLSHNERYKSSIVGLYFRVRHPGITQLRYKIPLVRINPRFVTIDCSHCRNYVPHHTCLLVRYRARKAVWETDNPGTPYLHQAPQSNDHYSTATHKFLYPTH